MAQQTPLTVETHETSPVGRTLDIQVEARRVDRAFDRAYRDLAKTAQVRGFRPGKVPRSVLEKLYGAAIAEEIERAIVADTLPEALEQTGLEPVSEPGIDAPVPKPGAAFQYRVRLEVAPTLELPDLAEITGIRPAVEVPDAQVQSELESLRERHAEWLEEPEDTTAAEGHRLLIDFVGRIDGETFEGGSAQGVELDLGAGRFLPGFEDQRVGARADEDREVRITFPEDYGPAELNGKEAVFQVHLAAIKRKELPELDDEFAKDLGEFEDLAALRERLRSDLEAHQERAAESALDRSLLDALAERVPVDLPPGMVERHLERRLARAHRELRNQVPEDDLRAQLSRWREEWRGRAEIEVRDGLLLEAVAERETVEVSDDEVEAEIEREATSQGVEVKRLRQAFEERGMLAGLRSQLRERKALGRLREKANVETGQAEPASEASESG